MGCAASTAQPREAVAPLVQNSKPSASHASLRVPFKGSRDYKYISELCVYKAVNLPKISSGSPNSFVIISGEGASFQTKTIKDDQNPNYQESFLFPCASLGTGISVHVKLEIYHEGPKGSKRIAHAQFFTDGYPPNQLPHLSLALAFDDPEHSRLSPNATLEIGIPGWVYNYAMMRQQLVGSTFGLVTNDAAHRLYLPMSSGVYLGIEYLPHEVEIKVCIARKASTTFVEIIRDSPEQSELQRQVWQEGHEVAPGFKVFEEIKLKGLGLAFDCSRIVFRLSERLCKSALDLDSILVAHNWRAGELFSEAANTLTNSTVDQEEQTVYVPVESGDQPETAVFTKWTSDGPGPLKVAVLEPPSSKGRDEQGVLLGVVGHNYVAHCWRHTPALQLAGGKFPTKQIWSIESSSSDIVFSDIFLYKYQLSRTKQVCLLDQLKLRPEQYPWPPSRPTLVRVPSTENLEMDELGASDNEATEAPASPATPPLSAWVAREAPISLQPPFPPASLSSYNSAPQPFLGPPHSAESHTITLSAEPPVERVPTPPRPPTAPSQPPTATTLPPTATPPSSSPALEARPPSPLSEAPVSEHLTEPPPPAPHNHTLLPPIVLPFRSASTLFPMPMSPATGHRHWLPTFGTHPALVQVAPPTATPAPDAPATTDPPGPLPSANASPSTLLTPPASQTTDVGPPAPEPPSVLPMFFPTASSSGKGFGAAPQSPPSPPAVRGGEVRADSPLRQASISSSGSLDDNTMPPLPGLSRRPSASVLMSAQNGSMEGPRPEPQQSIRYFNTPRVMKLTESMEKKDLEGYKPVAPVPIYEMEPLPTTLAADDGPVGDGDSWPPYGLTKEQAARVDSLEFPGRPARESPRIW